MILFFVFWAAYMTILWSWFVAHRRRKTWFKRYMNAIRHIPDRSTRIRLLEEGLAEDDQLVRKLLG